MAQASVPRCDICKEEIAKVFCYDCRHFLCQSCNSFHEKFPTTKRHTVTDSCRVDRSILMLKSVCEDHELEFAYYCDDCACLICAQCVTSVHKDHSLTDISKVAATSRNDVVKHLGHINDNTKTLSRLIEAFKTTKQTMLQTGTTNFTKELTKVSQDLIEMIKRITELKMTQVSDFHALEKKQILYNLSQLEKTYGEYNSLHNSCTQSLEEKHDVSFFLIQTSLAREIEMLDAINIPEDPKEIERFDREDFVDLIINKIQRKYSISMKYTNERDKHMIVDHYQKTVQYKEKEIRRLNNILQRIDHQFQKYVEQKDEEIKRLHGEIRQISENNAQYEQFCRQTQDELQSFKSELERKDNTLQTVVKQRDEERTLKEDERKQKDEALTKLSAISGDRLRNNNPGITNLSDPNRPMKIAEKFTEMYDNDWTDSIEALEDLDLGEEECVKILLHFLTDSYEECGRLVGELDSHILKAVIISTCEEDTNESDNGTTLSSKTFGFQTITSEYKCIPSEDNKPLDQNIPADILKPMKDLRKKLTENNVEKLQKKLPDYLMKTRDLTEEHITACSKFVADCIKYAWMMQIQDPPVYIEWDFPSDTKIDTNILRSYTKAGDHVDFIVWPVLYLHKDGPVLNKGVVQPKSANK